ncbi:ACT domain-containing protein [Paenibacillus sp. GSMTC-2017]|uniref:ACT domain-containing protein n=1 Tax=Paenibacillus sp. GSMTC-2017 TaxID=2794350 RepID=UPI0018D7B049|nr:ACT domain-containing protein [Paenibacillus sp. GSMTC-2017]MBH5317143.1 ACT domain-containing protein [Paenibacillus sp. GSMTC-2017]
MAGRYYVVHEDILPEAILKTIEVKEMLSTGGAATVHEAVERVGLSRSAFYKYKDGVYALNEMTQANIVTVSMDLDHRAGILSSVLGLVASQGGNVLTMNQTIPLQGFANVVLSVDISQVTGDVSELVELLKQQAGVRKAAIIGRG